MDRAEILKTAESLINGPRKSDYGDLRNNFLACAELWNAWIAARTGTEIHLTPEDVAVMNMMIKMARLSNNISYADGWVDIAGYAALGGEISGA